MKVHLRNPGSSSACGVAATVVMRYRGPYAATPAQFVWVPARYQCATCRKHVDWRRIVWGNAGDFAGEPLLYGPEGPSATPEMQTIVETLFRCANDLRHRNNRDHRCYFDDERRVCESTMRDPAGRRCGRTPIAGGWGDWLNAIGWALHADSPLRVDGASPPTDPLADVVITVGCEAMHPRWTHTPTGCVGYSKGERSQLANRKRAATDLVYALASREPDGIRVSEATIDALATEARTWFSPVELAGLDRAAGDEGTP